MSLESTALASPLPGTLEELAREIESRPHILAAGGDEQLAQKALEVTKGIFDLGVSLESLSHPHLHPFLVSILEPPSVNLRSSSKAKAVEPEPETKSDPESLLPYTPLSVLTVDGLDPEQVWAQLELRTEGIANVVKAVGPGEQDMRDGDEGDDDEDEEDGSDEDMSVEEFRRMLMESGEEGVEDMDDEELLQLMEEVDSDEDSDEEGGFSFKDEEDMSDDDEDEDLEDDEDDEVDEDDSGDDEEEEDEDDEEEEGLSVEGSDIEISGEDKDDGEEDDELLEVDEEEEDGDEYEAKANDDTEALFAAGPSKPSSSRKRHPTLDDDFFSIDDFNRMTEEAEAGRVSSGRLGGDDDDEEELGDVGSMMLKGADEDDEITYADFFEPPRGATKAKGKGKGKESSKSKGKGKRKEKGIRFDEEEEMDEEEGDEDGDAGRGVFGRVKGDLFDDDSEEEQDEQTLSNHEKRQLALAKQIAELEQEAVGPKEWTLLGEASSRARPENSLLEENLDFEQVGKVVPVITEETVKTLEEMIKQRILDNNYDSPVRVRAYEPTPFLPSRYFELQDTQSNKSLAQIYEEEYQAAAAGGKAKDPRDEKLRKEHEEIEKLWGEICYKLDALSSLNFVPKQPKAQITTISDLPATTMESALPPTAAASTMLAPQELFAAPKASALVARTELTPEEAQRARVKVRREKKSERRKLGDMAELYGKKKKSVKDQKEEALKGLVKSGKGVTVVGKGAKEQGKAKKRGAEDAPREDGKRLKL